MNKFNIYNAILFSTIMLFGSIIFARPAKIGDQIEIFKPINMEKIKKFKIPSVTFIDGQITKNSHNTCNACSLIPDETQFISQFGSIHQYDSIVLNPHLYKVVNVYEQETFKTTTLSSDKGGKYIIICIRCETKPKLIEFVNDLDLIRNSLGSLGSVIEGTVELFSGQVSTINGVKNLDL